MIRKLLLFVALMGVGLGVMHFVIGWENFARIRDSDDDTPIKEREGGVGGGFVIDTIGDDQQDAVVIAGRGSLRIPHAREVELPDGGKRLLTTYVLSAEDSRPHPLADDRMQLFDVVVEFFDVVDDDPADPRTVHTATLEAKSAELQVGRDERGRPSVREDRDMDLTQVVLKSEPSAKIEPIEMRVSRVLVRHTDRGLSLRTPDRRAPFTVEIGEGDRTTVTGEGLEAKLPPEDAPGPRILELHVASNPVLVRGTSTLRAVGPLDYVEDMETRVGTVDLRDRVRADGLLSGGSGQPMSVSGDSMHGVIVRLDAARGRARRTGWLAFHLIGRPVTMSGAGAKLRCTRVDAAPSLAGEPSVFTASGAPVLEESGHKARFEARRIHLVRVREWLGALHRPFGFGDAFGRLVGEMFVFEDATVVTEGETGTSMRASRGARVLRSEGEDGPLLAVGLGAVEVERDGVTATGNRGFTLARDGAAQTLRLGPPEPVESHEYEITREGEQPLVVRGRGGTCSVEQRADGSSVFELTSPQGALEAEVDGGRLAAATRIAAVVGADGEIASLDAFGEPCTLTRPTPEGPVTGTARSVHMLGDGAYRLVGSPASIERAGEEGEVRGGEIEVFELGRRAVAVIVTRGGHTAAAHVSFDPSTEDRAAAPIDLDADRVRFLPYRLPDAVLRSHAGGQLRGWRAPFAAGLRAEHVLADGAVVIVQHGDAALDARGDRFVSRADGSAALLSGRPARARLRMEDGRSVTAIADRIRIERAEDGSERLVLLPVPDRDPVAIVGSADPSVGIANVRIECAGRIDADRQLVLFRGPIEATEVDDTGKPVAEGLRLAALGMELDADETGVLRELTAAGDVEMRLRGATARGDRLILDVLASRAKLDRSEGFAEIELPNGRVVHGKQLEIDYTNMVVTGWMVHIEET